MEKFDLYAELGIAKDASFDDIRAAYRSRSKHAHPDTGGDMETFHRLTLAHAVLTDPERRERYDRDGEYENLGPDNFNSSVMQAVAFLLGFIVNSELALGSTDVCAAMIAKAGESKNEAYKNLEGLERMQERYKALLGRFSNKNGAEPSTVNRLVQHSVDNLELRKKSLTEQIAALDGAIEFLQNTDFDHVRAVEYYSGLQRGPFTSTFTNYGS
jgi:curved DNA-binding protein CbpA